MAIGDRLRESLAQVLSRMWRFLFLRGLLAIAFGILVIMRPGFSLAAVILLFGAYLLVNGVLGLCSAILGHPDSESRWMLLVSALVSVGIGGLTLLAPGLTALVLLYFIATWSIVTGALEILTAIRLRREIRGEWMLALAGVVSVAFGAFLIAKPGPGALAVLGLLGAFAILLGLLLVALSLRIRGFAQKVRPHSG